MSVIQLHDKTFLRHQGHWFIHDPVWRPIKGLAWNGKEFVLLEPYCTDPMDPLYGYKFKAMKNYCERLPPPEEIKKDTSEWIGNPEWFFDRPVVLTPCAPRTLQTWKALNVRRRTMRKRNAQTFTRRNRKT